MNKKILQTLLVSFLGLFLVFAVYVHDAFAIDADKLTTKAHTALEDLYSTNEGAQALGEKAKGILVFPDIIKGGFIVGGQYGDGVMFKGARADSYYRSFAASYGLQAGVQKFGYVLFFMTDDDLDYLNRSEGWEIGVGPSIVVVDIGLARTLTTTTLKEGVYAIIFNQKGLMAGLGIQGTKITRIYPW